MKKITKIIVVSLMCLALAGCSNKTDKVTSTNRIQKNITRVSSQQAISGNEAADSNGQPENNRISYSCKKGSISLCIPDDWSHKIEKYKKTKEEESFGITFWKDSSKKKKISVQYTKWFGVCGTGLKTKKLKINNMDGEGGYYDGKPYWDYILFHKQFKNYFTVLNFCDSETWWKQNGGQVMEILDTLILKENK